MGISLVSRDIYIFCFAISTEQVHGGAICHGLAQLEQWLTRDLRAHARQFESHPLPVVILTPGLKIPTGQAFFFATFGHHKLPACFCPDGLHLADRLQPTRAVISELHPYMLANAAYLLWILPARAGFESKG